MAEENNIKQITLNDVYTQRKNNENLLSRKLEELFKEKLEGLLEDDKYDYETFIKTKHYLIQNPWNNNIEVRCSGTKINFIKTDIVKEIANELDGIIGIRMKPKYRNYEKTVTFISDSKMFKEFLLKDFSEIAIEESKEIQKTIDSKNKELEDIKKEIEKNEKSLEEIRGKKQITNQKKYDIENSIKEDFCKNLGQKLLSFIEQY